MPFRLAELERLLRHGLLMVKAAANADGRGDDKGADDENTHVLVPQLSLE